jgi:sterol 14-demethylase
MARKYRIVVDKGICQGHSVCVAEAPEIFRTVDNGGPYPMVDLITDSPPEALLAKAEAAEELCPNGVIRIVYEDD